jgi:hypothetical protein
VGHVLRTVSDLITNSIGQDLRKDRSYITEQTATSSRGSQYCGLYDNQEQCQCQFQGHEPHEFLWSYYGPAVHIVYLPVLRHDHRLTDSGSWPCLITRRSPIRLELIHALQVHLDLDPPSDSHVHAVCRPCIYSF